MSDELKPCPFRGSTNLSIETNSVQPDDFHDAHVVCNDCYAGGRHAMTLEGWLSSKDEAKAEAIVAWNRPAENAELRAKVEAQAIDERAAFEDAYTKQHAVEDPTIFQKWNDGEYVYDNIRSAFEGWMIARAALNGAKQ